MYKESSKENKGKIKEIMRNERKLRNMGKKEKRI